MTTASGGSHPLGVPIRPEHPEQTVLRGLREEFGISERRERVRWLGAVLEIDTLNVALVAHLDCAFDFAHIERNWASEPRPTHHHEASELARVDFAELVALERKLAGTLHPTSRVRVRLATASGPMGTLA